MTATNQKDTCVICGKRVQILRNGALRSHVGWRGSVYVGRGRGVRCEGRREAALTDGSER